MPFTRDTMCQLYYWIAVRYYWEMFFHKKSLKVSQFTLCSRCQIIKHDSWPIQPDILSPPLLQPTSRKPLWLDLQPVDIKSRWSHNWKSAEVVNSHLACDPTIRQPGFDLPRCDDIDDGNVARMITMNFNYYKSKISKRNLYSKWNIQIT